MTNKDVGGLLGDMRLPFGDTHVGDGRIGWLCKSILVLVLI
jgi:hypothetical protein